MTFKQLVKKLVTIDTVSITIFNTQKIIKGVAAFRTVNLPNDPYIKIVFHDHSFLLLMLRTKELFYADTIIQHIRTIKDEDIGVKTKIIYENKIYILVNKNDYQFVTHVYRGDYTMIEGEARFSDYMPKDETEILSLGWLSYTGKRADINPRKIETADIRLL